MKADDKDAQQKTDAVETVTLELPKQVLDFAEFYAALGNMERDVLLKKIVTEKLLEMKSALRALPHLSIPEIW